MGEKIFKLKNRLSDITWQRGMRPNLPPQEVSAGCIPCKVLCQSCHENYPFPGYHLQYVCPPGRPIYNTPMCVYTSKCMDRCTHTRSTGHSVQTLLNMFWLKFLQGIFWFFSAPIILSFRKWIFFQRTSSFFPYYFRTNHENFVLANSALHYWYFFQFLLPCLRICQVGPLSGLYIEFLLWVSFS